MTDSEWWPDLCDSCGERTGTVPLCAECEEERRRWADAPVERRWSRRGCEVSTLSPDGPIPRGKVSIRPGGWVWRDTDGNAGHVEGDYLDAEAELLAATSATG